MSLLQIIPELPLLRRELIELSHRRRTYVIRFVGAIVVLSVVLILYQRAIGTIAGAGLPANSAIGAPYNPNKYFGSGGMIFRLIVPMLFYAVQLLMPALICGAITLEKERNTLGTLFVTRLSPMTILLEKLGSRLVPMFTFLLLTFPLLAFVYSLGGVDTTLLISSLWLLLCECLLYACIGLMCSSWFATTVTAFIWSYVLTALLVMGSLILRIPVLTPFDVWQSTFALAPLAGGGWTLYPFIDSLLRISGIERDVTVTPGIWHLLGHTVVIVIASLPSLFAAMVCLLLARVFLIRRAFLSSSSILLKLFRKIDAFFTNLNDRTTGGVLIIKDRDSMPLFDPVRWRERSKKSLGKARYLIRILILLEGPTLFICLMAVSTLQSSDFRGLRGLLSFMWGLAALIIAVKTSTLISSEKARETLDALLSTPLTAKEILTQKIAGTRRLMLVLAMPIMTIHLTTLLMHFDAKTVFLQPTWQSTSVILSYSLLVSLTTFTVMHLVAWLSVLLGMRSHSQSKSVMAAITAIAAWVIFAGYVARPGGVVHAVLNLAWLGEPVSSHWDNNRYGFLGGAYQRPQQQVNAQIGVVLCLLRPDGGIQANESIPAAGANVNLGNSLPSMMSGSLPTALMAAVVVLMVQFLLMLAFRTITLRLAPRLLQRRDEQTAPSPQLHSSPDPFVAASEVIA